MDARIRSLVGLKIGSLSEKIMLIFKKKIISIFIILGLVGCNSPKLSNQNEVPSFSSKEYERLDCRQLADKLAKLQPIVDSLSGVDNEHHYVMHADMPLVGTGDSMGAVELLKVKAEIKAVKKVYSQKECQSQLRGASHNK